MVVFEVSRRDAMIFRMEDSSIRSSPSFEVGRMAIGADEGTDAGVIEGVEVTDFALTEARSEAAANASVEITGAFCGCLVAERTSLLTMRPAGPVPTISESLIPVSDATLRASGDALTRPGGVP